MRNWLAGIIAIAGVLFFFFIERNLLGFVVLVICAAIVAILFSEREMDERVKKIKEERQERQRKREKRSIRNDILSSEIRKIAFVQRIDQISARFQTFVQGSNLSQNLSCLEPKRWTAPLLTGVGEWVSAHGFEYFFA